MTIVSKVPNQAFRDNWEKIFGSKEEEPTEGEEDIPTETEQENKEE